MRFEDLQTSVQASEVPNDQRERERERADGHLMLLEAPWAFLSPSQLIGSSRTQVPSAPEPQAPASCNSDPVLSGFSGSASSCTPSSQLATKVFFCRAGWNRGLFALSECLCRGLGLLAGFHAGALRPPGPGCCCRISGRRDAPHVCRHQSALTPTCILHGGRLATRPPAHACRV